MRDWDRDVAAYAARVGLTPEQTDAIQGFVKAMMRLDSVEVSIDTVTWSEITTQAMTASTEHFEPSEEGLPVGEAPERRYLDMGRIGIGGMGEVRRVRDTLLNRFIAMKILREEFAQKRPAVLRFIAEAQATAQLQHPGMVPVHDLGQLPDGRWFFTMKEVKGETLEEVFRSFRSGESTRSLRALIELLTRVCDAVAYAHANGAVHRDLKPANVLVGAFGEVVVLDWGLVKATGSPTGDASVVTNLSSMGTKLGTVIGTPAYMPPEQARGQHDDVGPATDVYAIGAVLYELLSGRRPFLGSANEVIEQILTSAPPELPSTVPSALAEICGRAMSKHPDDRYAHAGLLADAFRDWLDGAARRERALELIRRADELQPRVETSLARADELGTDAHHLLGSVASWADTAAKREGWRLLDEAEQERIRADLIGLERLQLLRSALTEMPEMPEAHERLAYVYHFCHVRAERHQDMRDMAHYEMLLRAHDRGKYQEYLEGEGRLSLSTLPANARVALYRFETQDRRRVPVFVRDLGEPPFRSLPLPHGSWLLVASQEGRRSARIPVSIERAGHWHGVPPGAKASAPILLPWESDLEPDDCYVPAGWCKVGSIPSRPVWVDGFIMKRFPVTNGQYLFFLNDLVARGDDELAVQLQPATESGSCFRRTVDGTFELSNPHTGAAWDPEWPVVYVDQNSALAYATWLSARTGDEWRLPWEVEWEKAARGADGRRYVMGDFLDPSWADIRGASPEEAVHPVQAFPLDESVYGVRGLTGGVADWCLDRHTGPELTLHGGRLERVRAHGDQRVVCRGGMRTVPEDICMAYFRHAVAGPKRSVRVGFRLVRSLVPELDPETSGVWVLRP